jgi:hypothetical protein
MEVIGIILTYILVASPVILAAYYFKKRKDAKETSAKTFFKTKDGK